MKYIRLELRAGKGGDGIISWSKTKYNSRLGPAGGNGGDGGNVYLSVDSKFSDFSHLKTSEKKAQNGLNGQKENKSGASGSCLYLKVPLNTEIYDLNQKIRKSILAKVGEDFLLCKGGKGGRGNASFKNAQFQAPWLYEAGEEGESLSVLLITENTNYVGIVSIDEDDSLADNLISKLNNLGSDLNFTFFPLEIFEKEIIKPFYLKELEICKIIVLVSKSWNQDLEEKREELYKTLKKLGFYSCKTICLAEEKLNNISKNQEIIFSSWETLELKNIYKELSQEAKKITQLPCFKPYSSQELKDDYIEYSDSLLPEKEEYQITKTLNGWEVSSRRLNYWTSRIPQTTLHNIERLKTKLKVEEIIKQIKKSGGIVGETLKICNYTTNIY